MNKDDLLSRPQVINLLSITEEQLRQIDTLNILTKIQDKYIAEQIVDIGISKMSNHYIFIRKSIKRILKKKKYDKEINFSQFISGINSEVKNEGFYLFTDINKNIYAFRPPCLNNNTDVEKFLDETYNKIKGKE